jgi:hypothetical protein
VDVKKILKNGYPQTDLGKSGYKPDMKYKSLINPLYLWMPDENQISKYGNCDFFWGEK